ncbi:MAG: hypothetical protein AABY28_01000 [Candidatus Omnitrophota bacterium]
MERKLKYLEMIQGVINRMGQCSFLLKGWSVVLVSALFALAANKTNILFIYLAYFPAIAFWMLDGYYLYQERLFRNLYDKARDMDTDKIDFSMDTRPLRGINKATWQEATFSKTMLIFHGTVIFTILVIMAVCLI